MNYSMQCSGNQHEVRGLSKNFHQKTHDILNLSLNIDHQFIDYG